MTVTGARLDTIVSIKVDGQAAELISVAESKIDFIAPAGKPGFPELRIQFATGYMTWSNALTYFDIMVEKAKLANRIPKPAKAIKPAKVVKKSTVKPKASAKKP